MTGARPRLILFGAGRMGRLLYECAEDAGFIIRSVVAPSLPDWLDRERWADNVANLDEGAEVLIDFSSPEGLETAARWCRSNGVPLVSGTTGSGESGRQALQEAAERIPVLWAANFSPGLNLCLQMVTAVARRAPEVQRVAITDLHHRHKRDAPSGTALALGAAVAPLKPEYTSRREGEHVGEHRVRFEFSEEVVEFVHQALDRSVFARGALRAGQWLRDQPPGLYTASDWLAAAD